MLHFKQNWDVLIKATTSTLKNIKHGVSRDAECGRQRDKRGKAKRRVFATWHHEKDKSSENIKKVGS
jgi:hypothetical protein